MNMKRIFSVLTAAVIAFVFSACGNGSVELKAKTADTGNQSTEIFFRLTVMPFQALLSLKISLYLLFAVMS